LPTRFAVTREHVNVTSHLVVEEREHYTIIEKRAAGDRE